MGQLLEDLLEISRVGRMDTRPEHVEASAVVEQVVAEIQQSDDRVIDFVVAEDLPAAWSNPKRLYQVFGDLIGNAVEFTVGTPATCIEIGGENVEGVTTYFVRDNGPGIRRESQEAVFELFHRLHSEDVPGTGVGLAFTRRIVESMGGQIWLESTLGDGTTFFFTVPGADGAAHGA